MNRQAQQGHESGAAPLRLPEWLPAETANWLRRVLHKLPSFKQQLSKRLTFDERMRPVWEWLCGELPKATGVAPQLSIFFGAELGLNMPSKPGDMPPKQRERYFSDVRRHAMALAQLLEDTRFDSLSTWRSFTSWESEEIESMPDKAAEDLRSAMSWVDHPDGAGPLIVAYLVDDTGVEKKDFLYPESELTETLHALMEWTHDEDYWGRNFLASSRPLRQSGRHSRVQYFTCTFYENMLKNHGLTVPASLLATIANVALELPIDEQLEEDAARKQVARHIERYGKPKPNFHSRIESKLPF